MKRLIFLSVLFIFIFSIRCSRNPVSGSGDRFNIKLLSRMTESGRYTLFIYSGVQLARSETYKNGVMVAWTSCYFDSAGRLSGQESYDEDMFSLNNSLWEYHYDQDGLPERVDIRIRYGQNPNYSLPRTRKFTYDTNRQIIRIEDFWEDGTRAHYRDLGYDAAGNVIEIRDYQGEQLYYKMDFQRDDKINPLYSLKNALIAEGTFSPNNVVSEVIQHFDGRPARYTEIECAYDDDGLIVSETFTDYENANIVSVRTMEYEYMTLKFGGPDTEP